MTDIYTENPSEYTLSYRAIIPHEHLVSIANYPLPQHDDFFSSTSTRDTYNSYFHKNFEIELDTDTRFSGPPIKFIFVIQRDKIDEIIKYINDYKIFIINTHNDTSSTYKRPYIIDNYGMRHYIRYTNVFSDSDIQYCLINLSQLVRSFAPDRIKPLSNKQIDFLNNTIYVQKMLFIEPSIRRLLKTPPCNGILFNKNTSILGGTRNRTRTINRNKTRNRTRKIKKK